MKEGTSYYMETHVIDKVAEIAKQEKRSKSYTAEYLMKLGLKEYEKQNSGANKL